jgi:hypothetical protein
MSPWRRALEASRNDASASANRFARTHRLVVRVDGVAHEIVKLDGNTASVTLACEPTLGLLVDPNTIVFEHGEIDVDCMTCLVRRAWVS